MCEVHLILKKVRPGLLRALRSLYRKGCRNLTERECERKFMLWCELEKEVDKQF